MAKLIINADDFGMSEIHNSVILELLTSGQISSTTVLINQLTDQQENQLFQLKYLMNQARISVGLHTEFTYDQHLEQVESQFKKFLEVFGREPSHLDIHKEHLHTAYHDIVDEFCNNKGLAFRNHGRQDSCSKTTSEKYYFGSNSSFKNINQWLKKLKQNKSYELVFHPGCYDPNCSSSLNRDREIDVGHIRRIHNYRHDYNFNLISFNQLQSSNTT